MVLNVNANYPHAQSFVLKLHRDAEPSKGRIVGRLEHLVSGQQFLFTSADELLDCLVRALARGGQEAERAAGKE